MTRRRPPWRRPAAAALSCLLLLALPAAAAAGPRAPVDGSRTAATAASGGEWRLPVPGAPLLRGFVAPAHAYAAGHRGVDLGAAPDAAVVAPAAGVVAFSGGVAGRPVLAVDHGAGVRSAVEPVVGSVPEGTAVAAGATVGTVAAAGWHCPVTCLHWGVRVDGDYVDPMSLLRPPVVLLPLLPGQGAR